MTKISFNDTIPMIITFYKAFIYKILLEFDYKRIITITKRD